MKRSLFFFPFLILAVAGAVAQTADNAVALPGLRLEISTAAAKDVKQVDRPALAVAAGSPASPFVPAGAFSAVFSGKLNLDTRSRLYFSFEGTGSAKLIIGGEVVVEAKDKFAGIESERLRLNKGEHEFRLEYQSPQTGDAHIRLLWRERSFGLEPVPGTVFTHQTDEALQEATILRHGRELVAQHHCTKCHSPGDLADSAMPELAADAPKLAGIGTRLNPEWIAQWLVKPSAMRPGATMPALFGHDSVAEAIKAKDSRPWDVAAYLASLTTPPAKAPTGDPVHGGTLFHNLGCIACHQAPDQATDANDKLNRIPLSGVKAKFKPAALVAFLKDPTANYKWIRMPHFGLSEQEAADLAALLLKHAADPPVIAGTPKGDPEKGKKLVAELNCMNCHDGLGEPTFEDKPYFGIAKTDWLAKGCLAPPAKRGKAPAFNLADAQRTALAAFAKTDGKSLNRHHPAEFADRQIRELNCAACHVNNGAGNHWGAVAGESAHFATEAKHEGSHLSQTRPTITLAGAKLNTDWLQKLIAGETSPRPRPWLAAKMPAFPARADQLAIGMAAQHGLAPSAADESPATKELVPTGRQLLSPNNGFACVICHAVGDQKAIAPFESQGINLMLANERLHHDYFLRWMLNPPRLEPTTKMPKYANDDGTTPLIDVLNGDANQQFNAMWEFLKAGREAPATH